MGIINLVVPKSIHIYINICYKSQLILTFILVYNPIFSLVLFSSVIKLQERY
jgi:hypothetical protein